MNNNSAQVEKFVFFGTSEFAVDILDELKKEALLPAVIVTTPDKPKGRKLILSASPVKTWALENGIQFIQPEKLKDPAFVKKMKEESYDLFVVASYGKIVPSPVLDIPAKGSLNIHPSLLPKYRGPSPIQYQILENEKEVGATIIQMDNEVDHGPIVAQERLAISESDWPLPYDDLEKKLAKLSAKLLIDVLRIASEAKLRPAPQDDKRATFTSMIKKEDGLIDIEADPFKNYLKYLAYRNWPGTYFFTNKEGGSVRLKIKEADYKDGKFNIKKVVPEGKREMSYEDFLKGI